MPKYNFSPIVTRNSIFEKEPYLYVYLNNDGSGHIHMYEGLVNLGFDDTAKVNFMYDFEQKVLFMFCDANNGQTITQVKKSSNHMSIKCNDMFKKIGLKPLDPVIEGKSNSGRYLFAKEYEFNDIKGVIVDFKQFV